MALFTFCLSQLKHFFDEYYRPLFNFFKNLQKRLAFACLLRSSSSILLPSCSMNVKLQIITTENYSPSSHTKLFKLIQFIKSSSQFDAIDMSTELCLFAPFVLHFIAGTRGIWRLDNSWHECLMTYDRNPHHQQWYSAMSLCMCEETGMGQTEEPLELNNRFPVSMVLKAIIHTH